jgi:formate hydrogenlyase subunit 3/multisubunit Na+/H+ antiporter MnhD subunit
MAWLATGVTGALGGLMAFADFEVPILFQGNRVTLGASLNVLGRILVIEPVDRLPLAFMCFTAAGLFIIAWRLLPHSNFYPAGVAMVALLSGALMVEQVVYAALLVVMAALFGIFPLYEPVIREDGTHYGGSSKGGLQYIAYISLALPGLMITHLLLEQASLFPNDIGILRTSTVLLGLSFALLLGAVPFQSWLSTVAMDGSPPVVTFLFTVNLGTVWFLLLAYLDTYQWLGEQASLASLFTSVGLTMIVVGGVLAAAHHRLGRMVGYVTLVDNGAMLVALGTQQLSGLALTVLMLLARPIALGLMTLGLDGLRRFGDGNDHLESLQGAAWITPWRTLAFVVGGIAMAGFPLTLGFSVRWGFYRLLTQSNLFLAVIALSGSAGVMMGLVTALRVFLAPSPETLSNGTGDGLGDDPVVLFLILALVVATTGLGLFPQTLAELAMQVAEGFTFFTT